MVLIREVRLGAQELGLGIHLGHRLDINLRYQQIHNHLATITRRTISQLIAIRENNYNNYQMVSLVRSASLELELSDRHVID